MLPVAFLVTSAKGNERQALLKMLEKGVTYIADRGYMSVKIYRQIVSAEANFIFRVKANLLYSVIEPLIVKLPENMKGILNVSDQLIRYTHDESKGIYRLVTFTLYQEVFYILTNRKDLTTYQIIVLYSYRWQIELIFRFLKRTLNGIHLIKQNEEGVTIQFYALLIVAMLQLYLKQITVERSTVGRNKRGRVKTTVITETESNSEKLESSEVGFLEKIGENLRKYWKIGIDWLTSLKELLSAPFDERAIRVLSKY
jgi:transposase